MRGFVFLALLLASMFARAQTPTAQEVGARFYLAQGSVLGELLKQLDLPQEVIDEYTSYSKHLPQEIHWFYLKSRPGTSLNVLALPCSSMLGAPVFLLERVDGQWHLRDREGMDCHYDDSANAQLVTLTSRKQYDLLLHHDCDSRGTGYIEQHARVLRIVGSHFVKALNKAEIIHAFPQGTSAGGSFDESVFLPIALGTLEQTRRTTSYDQNDQPRISAAVTVRRIFHWNGKRFVASPWQTLH